MENLPTPWFLNGDNLYAALAPATKLQMIAVNDIGKHGARAFTEAEKLNRQEIDIAGDEATLPQTAEALSKGLGRTINFVQIPTMPSVPAELKPGVSKYIAPKALFWFRWSAAVTVLLGIGIATLPQNNYFVDALTFQPGFRLIGTGMWFGLIMAFNVWFVIWPNQQRVLGLVDYPADQKPKAARIALIASRTNTMLSIGMLYCMVAQSHGGL